MSNHNGNNGNNGNKSNDHLKKSTLFRWMEDLIPSEILEEPSPDPIPSDSIPETSENELSNNAAVTNTTPATTIPSNTPMPENTMQSEAAMWQYAGLPQDTGMQWNEGMWQNSSMCQDAGMWQHLDVLQNIDLPQSTGMQQNTIMYQYGDMSQNADLSQGTNMQQNVSMWQDAGILWQDAGNATGMPQAAAVLQITPMSQNTGMKRNTDVPQDTGMPPNKGPLQNAATSMCADKHPNPEIYPSNVAQSSMAKSISHENGNRKVVKMMPYRIWKINSSEEPKSSNNSDAMNTEPESSSIAPINNDASSEEKLPTKKKRVDHEYNIKHLKVSISLLKPRTQREISNDPYRRKQNLKNILQHDNCVFLGSQFNDKPKKPKSEEIAFKLKNLMRRRDRNPEHSDASSLASSMDVYRDDILQLATSKDPSIQNEMQEYIKDLELFKMDRSKTVSTNPALRENPHMISKPKQLSNKKCSCNKRKCKLEYIMQI